MGFVFSYDTFVKTCLLEFSELKMFFKDILCFSDFLIGYGQLVHLDSTHYCASI